MDYKTIFEVYLSTGFQNDDSDDMQMRVQLGRDA